MVAPRWITDKKPPDLLNRTAVAAVLSSPIHDYVVMSHAGATPSLLYLCKLNFATRHDRAGYLLLMAVPRARQTYTLTYDLNTGTMLLAGEPTVGRELIGSLATVNRPSRFHSLPRFSSNQFLSFRQCSPRGSRRFIWGTHLSESPSPPEPNLESRAHPDGYVARIVHRLRWRFVVSNRPAPWPTMGL
jgi:hypothetical protein